MDPKFHGRFTGTFLSTSFQLCFCCWCPSWVFWFGVAQRWVWNESPPDYVARCTSSIQIWNFSGIFQPAMSHLTEGITPKMTGAWKHNLTVPFPKPKVHPWKFNSLPLKKPNFPFSKGIICKKAELFFTPGGGSLPFASFFSGEAKSKASKGKIHTKNTEVRHKTCFIPIFREEKNAMQSNQSMFCPLWNFGDLMFNRC